MTQDATNHPAAPAKSLPREEKPSGVRAVIEQVVLALALAFVFRAFVVEAFIIPTGSMATTLLGAHMRFDCPDCGWEYDVNYPTPRGATLIPKVAQNAEGEARTYNFRCPNCGFRLPPEAVEGYDTVSEDAAAPPVYYGDRILVLKYEYLFKGPQRYDVVVFKNPSRSGASPRLSPESTLPYQESFIKRLVGLPGERIMLLDGDVYVAADDRNKTDAELKPDDFRIARKDDSVQSALWRVVYDDRYRPRGISRDQQVSVLTTEREPTFQMPWQPSGAWQADEEGFVIGDAGGSAIFDADAQPRAFHLTDYLAYNQTIRENAADRNQPALTFGRRFEFPGGVGAGIRHLHYADDLQLNLVHERLGGKGPLELTLSGNGKTFHARLAEDQAILLDSDETVAQAKLDAAGETGEPTRVTFEHVDYRVTLRVDGDVVLRHEYEPEVAQLVEQEQDRQIGPKPEVGVAAVDHAARITHLSLYRDVHYTPRRQIGRTDAEAAQLNVHASPEDFPDGVMRLGEDEYFVIGDNPMLSGDARTWTDAVVLRRERLAVGSGRVPGRFLLGKAFFVYWPGGYRPLPFLPPIVPNVGDMRFIR
jgi:signal peptidase I